jgi:Zn-dependent protease
MLGSNSIIDTVALVLTLLIAISVHEATHAYIALRLGDPTAKVAGRLTLNPFAHLDPLGTLALLIIHFGWGKPVPVNPNNFRKPSVGNLLVALAGPASNIIMALIGALFLHFTVNIPFAGEFFSVFLVINIFLAIFNLLPVPPLDGSKIWHLFLSDESYYTLERLGPFILLAVIIFSFSSGGSVFNIISNISQKIINLIT